MNNSNDAIGNESSCYGRKTVYAATRSVSTRPFNWNYLHLKAVSSFIKYWDLYRVLFIFFNTYLSV